MGSAISQTNWKLNTSHSQVRRVPDNVIRSNMVSSIDISIGQGFTRLTRLNTMVVFDQNPKGRLEMWHSDSFDFQSLRFNAHYSQALGLDQDGISFDFSEKTAKRTMLLVPLELMGDNASSGQWRASSDFHSLTNAVQTPLFCGNTLRSCSIPSGESMFYALMVVPSDDALMSRTGILFVGGNGNFYPVIWSGKKAQFLVELKGLGNPAGIFNTHHRLSGDHYTGLVKASEAASEFVCLEFQRVFSARFQREETVRGLAFLPPQDSGRSTSYLMRLTPTNRRSTWTGNPIFPQMDDPQIAKSISYALGMGVGELLGLKKPMLHGCAHPENLLIYQQNQHALTDFSNMFLWDRVPPDNRFKALHAHYFAVTQINGYRPGECEQAWLDGFTSSLVDAQRIDGSCRDTILGMSDQDLALKLVLDKFENILDK